ncbi:Hypothetical protein FKW44_016535 [Caligus rogercresseyi]|uniref:Uncharacterized protein n=1 Tax=Caligus rogercresseyi TaxID=217165 RepID=A0A7T8H2J3_CALRO|nr:Hypothetical protein FKW44_016535 [Caligus rogercresseyi]
MGLATGANGSNITAGPERGLHHLPGSPGRDLDLSCHGGQQVASERRESSSSFAEDK